MTDRLPRSIIFASPGSSRLIFAKPLLQPKGIHIDQLIEPSVRRGWSATWFLNRSVEARAYLMTVSSPCMKLTANLKRRLVYIYFVAGYLWRSRLGLKCIELMCYVGSTIKETQNYDITWRAEDLSKRWSLSKAPNCHRCDSLIDLKSGQSYPRIYFLELHISWYEWAAVLFTILSSTLRISMKRFRFACIYRFKGITDGCEAIPQYLDVR